jgi:hypothetical protein
VNDPGDIPDNQAFVPFTSADGTFTLTVPEGWAQKADGTAIVFSSKANSVRIEQAQAAVAPDPGSVKATQIPGLQATVPGFKAGSVASVERKSGPVLQINYNATSAADPVTGKSLSLAVERYEFWKAGTTVTVTLAAPDGSDNVDPWRKITDSFQWKR